MPHTDELLDLVDENDHVIGTMERSKIYAQGLTNFRVVNAFLVNSKGELWIPRRTATKQLFPLGLDMSVAGHVESGENYDETLRREAQEELNIDIDTMRTKLLGHLTPYNDNVSAFMNVYEIAGDQTPNYNRNDFAESYWITPTELLDRIGSGDRAKDDLPKLVRRFYGSSG